MLLKKYQLWNLLYLEICFKKLVTQLTILASAPKTTRGGKISLMALRGNITLGVAR